MTRDDCIFLGTIAKAHGVRGEMIFRTRSETFEPQKNMGSVFLEIDGILVPFFIAGIQPHKKGEWILALDDYDEKEKALELVGFKVWVLSSELKEEEPGEVYLDTLVGYHLLDQTSNLEGPITDYIDIADNPLFEVSFPGGKIMVPAREEWILEIDEKERRLMMELPGGLVTSG